MLPLDKLTSCQIAKLPRWCERSAWRDVSHLTSRCVNFRGFRYQDLGNMCPVLFVLLSATFMSFFIRSASYIVWKNILYVHHSTYCYDWLVGGKVGRVTYNCSNCSEFERIPALFKRVNQHVLWCHRTLQRQRWWNIMFNELSRSFGFRFNDLQNRLKKSFSRLS